jgi:hypothetical protein
MFTTTALWVFNSVYHVVSDSLSQIITKLAVKWITRQLRKDKDFWYCYQANIAMTISDNMNRYMPLRADHPPTKHEFCHICANDFLKLWTKKE